MYELLSECRFRISKNTKISFNRLYKTPVFLIFKNFVYNIFSYILKRSLPNFKIMLTSKNYLNSFQLVLHISFIDFKQSLKKFIARQDVFNLKYFPNIFINFIWKCTIDLLTQISFIFFINS